jgi:hypothetical protein
MFEIYDNMGRTVDRYLILIYGTGSTLKPYYDITSDAEDIFMHGNDWSDADVERIRKDRTLHRVSWRKLPAGLMAKLLDELETDVI